MDNPMVFIAKTEAKEFYQIVIFLGVIQSIILSVTLGCMAWFDAGPMRIICTGIVLGFFFLVQIIASVAKRLDAGRAWTEQAMKQLLDGQQ